MACDAFRVQCLSCETCRLDTDKSFIWAQHRALNHLVWTAADYAAWRMHDIQAVAHRTVHPLQASAAAE